MTRLAALRQGQGVEMILGLPHARRGALLDRARALGATVLVSANAFAIRRKDDLGLPRFEGFDPRSLANLAGVPACLDSAGFVAMTTYGGFDWTVEQYVAFAAAHPWRWFASMDACVEPEIAPDRDEVLNRIAWTVALNMACAQEAERRGIADRLLPVIQGARPEDYVCCLDRMGWAADQTRIGVGSMCRRATGGLDGVLACVEAIDRALSSCPARLHLFGVKSDAAEALRGHPRVESADSQAYGVQARQIALEANLGRVRAPDLFGHTSAPVSKSDAFVAQTMEQWWRRQDARLRRPGRRTEATAALVLDGGRRDAVPPDLAARLDEAREEMRALVEQGEMEWTDLHEQAVWEWAFMEEAA